MLIRSTAWTLLVSLALLGLGAQSASARDQIRIVGSSTVYPFATVVAEEFGRGRFRTPIIESTGTGTTGSPHLSADLFVQVVHGQLIVFGGHRNVDSVDDLIIEE